MLWFWSVVKLLMIRPIFNANDMYKFDIYTALLCLNANMYKIEMCVWPYQHASVILRKAGWSPVSLGGIGNLCHSSLHISSLPNCTGYYLAPDERLDTTDISLSHIEWIHLNLSQWCMLWFDVLGWHKMAVSVTCILILALEKVNNMSLLRKKYNETAVNTG